MTFLQFLTVANLVLCGVCALANVESRNWQAVGGWVVATLALTQLLLLRLA
jgi:hypothetical protein